MGQGCASSAGGVGPAAPTPAASATADSPFSTLQHLGRALTDSSPHESSRAILLPTASQRELTHEYGTEGSPADVATASSITSSTPTPPDGAHGHVQVSDTTAGGVRGITQPVTLLPSHLAVFQQATSSSHSAGGGTAVTLSLATMPAGINPGHLFTAATLRSEGGTEATARLPGDSVVPPTSALLASETSTARLMDCLYRESAEHNAAATITSSSIARQLGATAGSVAATPAASAARRSSVHRMPGNTPTGIGSGFSLFGALQAFVEHHQQGEFASVSGATGFGGGSRDGPGSRSAGQSSAASIEPFRGFNPEPAADMGRDVPTANLYRVQPAGVGGGAGGRARSPKRLADGHTGFTLSPLGPGGRRGDASETPGSLGPSRYGSRKASMHAELISSGIGSDTALAMAEGLIIGGPLLGSTGGSQNAAFSDAAAPQALAGAAAAAELATAAGAGAVRGADAGTAGFTALLSGPYSFDGANSFLSGQSNIYSFDEPGGRHAGSGGGAAGSDTEGASRTDNAVSLLSGHGGGGDNRSWRMQRTAERREFLSAAKCINAVLQDVQIISVLGAGAHGKVYKGALRDRFVAIKVTYHDTDVAPLLPGSVSGGLQNDTNALLAAALGGASLTGSSPTASMAHAGAVARTGDVPLDALSVAMTAGTKKGSDASARGNADAPAGSGSPAASSPCRLATAAGGGSRPAVHTLSYQRAGSSNLHALPLSLPGSTDGASHAVGTPSLPVLSLPGMPPVVMPHKTMLEGLISASAQHPNIVETYRIVTQLLSSPGMPAFVVTRGSQTPMWETTNLPAAAFLGIANASVSGLASPVLSGTGLSVAGSVFGGPPSSFRPGGAGAFFAGRQPRLQRASSLGPTRDAGAKVPPSVSPLGLAGHSVGPDLVQRSGSSGVTTGFAGGAVSADHSAGSTGGKAAGTLLGQVFRRNTFAAPNGTAVRCGVEERRSSGDGGMRPHAAVQDDATARDTDGPARSNLLGALNPRVQKYVSAGPESQPSAPGAAEDLPAGGVTGAPGVASPLLCDTRGSTVSFGPGLPPERGSTASSAVTGQGNPINSGNAMEVSAAPHAYGSGGAALLPLRDGSTLSVSALVRTVGSSACALGSTAGDDAHRSSAVGVAAPAPEGETATQLRNKLHSTGADLAGGAAAAAGAEGGGLAPSTAGRLASAGGGADVDRREPTAGGGPNAVRASWQATMRRNAGAPAPGPAGALEALGSANEQDSAELILDLLGAQAAAQRSHSFLMRQRQLQQQQHQVRVQDLDCAKPSGQSAGLAGAPEAQPSARTPPAVPPSPRADGRGPWWAEGAEAASPPSWGAAVGADSEAAVGRALATGHGLQAANQPRLPSAPSSMDTPFDEVSVPQDDYMVTDDICAAPGAAGHFGLATTPFSSQRTETGSPASTPLSGVAPRQRSLILQVQNGADADSEGAPQQHSPPSHRGIEIEGAAAFGAAYQLARGEARSPPVESAAHASLPAAEPSLALPPPLSSGQLQPPGVPGAGIGSAAWLPTIDELTAGVSSVPLALPAALLGPARSSTSSTARNSLHRATSGLSDQAGTGPSAGAGPATGARNSSSGASVPSATGTAARSMLSSIPGGTLLPAELQYDKLSWSNYTHTSASTNAMLNSGFTALLASINTAGGSAGGGAAGAAATTAAANSTGTNAVASSRLADSGGAATALSRRTAHTVANTVVADAPISSEADGSIFHTPAGSDISRPRGSSSIRPPASERDLRHMLKGPLSRSFTDARSSRSSLTARRRLAAAGGVAGGGGPGGVLPSTAWSGWSGGLAPPGRERWQVLIVQELCSKGNLRDAIASGIFHSSNVAAGTQVIAMRQLLDTAAEIASAMAYLHSRAIVHGDLKSANVLLQRNDTDPRGFISKLADFGLARQLGKRGAEDGLLVSRIGTVTHMAPETIQDNMVVLGSDVYSYGVLLWELFCAQTPWVNYTPFQLLSAVVQYDERPQFPAHCPPAYAALAVRCMAKSHRDRPTFLEIHKELMSIRDTLFGGSGHGTISVPLAQARSEATRVLQTHLQAMSGSLAGIAGGVTSGTMRDFSTQESNFTSSLESWDIYSRPARRGEAARAR